MGNSKISDLSESTFQASANSVPNGKISSPSVLLLHGVVDTSNSKISDLSESTFQASANSVPTGKILASQWVSALHSEVDTCHGKTSSPSVLLLHGVVDTSNSRTSSSSDGRAHTEPIRSQLVPKVLHI